MKSQFTEYLKKLAAYSEKTSDGLITDTDYTEYQEFEKDIIDSCLAGEFSGSHDRALRAMVYAVKKDILTALEGSVS